MRLLDVYESPGTLFLVMRAELFELYDADGAAADVGPLAFVARLALLGQAHAKHILHLAHPVLLWLAELG